MEIKGKVKGVPESGLYLSHYPPELISDNRECLLYFAKTNGFILGTKSEGMWHIGNSTPVPLDTPDAVYVLPERHFETLGLKNSAEKYLIAPEYTGPKGEA